jgi:hypothetical protein
MSDWTFLTRPHVIHVKFDVLDHIFHFPSHFILLSFQFIQLIYGTIQFLEVFCFGVGDFFFLLEFY